MTLSICTQAPCCCVRSDEIALVRESSGPDVVWENPETFFLKTTTINHMLLRLQCWQFKSSFEDTIEKVRLVNVVE